MARYRKKPVTVEAVLVGEILDAWVDGEERTLPDWVLQAFADRTIDALGGLELYVRTLEGIMTGDRDDMLIRGVQGELYLCKPDIFQATYELVDEK